MPDTLQEVIDVNLVAVPAVPLTQIANPRATLESDAFRQELRTPLTYNQGLIVDPAGTTMLSYQIESMRSQKSIVISPQRIELHDRSGDLPAQTGILPDLMVRLLHALNIDDLKAVGANFDLLCRFGEDKGTAARAIANGLLQRNLGFLPSGVTLSGGSTRLFLSGEHGVKYIFVIEPRFNDVDTLDAFLSCNVEVAATEVPPVDQLTTIFQSGYGVLRAIVTNLLPGTAESLPQGR